MPKIPEWCSLFFLELTSTPKINLFAGRKWEEAGGEAHGQQNFDGTSTARTACHSWRMLMRKDGKILSLFEVTVWSTGQVEELTLLSSGRFEICFEYSCSYCSSDLESHEWTHRRLSLGLMLVVLQWQIKCVDSLFVANSFSLFWFFHSPLLLYFSPQSELEARDEKIQELHRQLEESQREITSLTSFHAVGINEVSLLQLPKFVFFSPHPVFCRNVCVYNGSRYEECLWLPWFVFASSCSAQRRRGELRTVAAQRSWCQNDCKLSVLQMWVAVNFHRMGGMG